MVKSLLRFSHNTRYGTYCRKSRSISFHIFVKKTKGKLIWMKFIWIHSPKNHKFINNYHRKLIKFINIHQPLPPSTTASVHHRHLGKNVSGQDLIFPTKK